MRRIEERLSHPERPSIENGKRPATETFALMCDRVFPEREGWFSEFWQESRAWLAVPPWFRSWIEHEQHTTVLRSWFPSVLDGLLQTEDYARTLLSLNPGVTADVVAERITARLARQALLTRDEPPTVWFLVDEAALLRCIGSPQIMAAQCAHLLGVASLPNATIQVVPNAANVGLLGGFAVADRAVYVETTAGGQVFEDAETHTALLTRFDTLLTEALRGTESQARIEEISAAWRATGGRPATPGTTAETA
jgi:hypothetical protein